MRALAICCFLFGCFDTPSDDSQLSSSDINAISGALTTAMNAGISASHRRPQPENAVSAAANCPAGGHITITGNFYVDAQAGTFSVSLTMQVGDRSNNLNDCDVGGGLILDGTIRFDMSGSAASWSGNMNGSLSINRRGPTGGLVPITSDCGIFVGYRSDGYAAGTICGETVSN